jgi:hypothetical protein
VEKRIPWDDLPGPLKAAIAERTGPVTAGRAVTDGQNSPLAAVIDTPGGKVFVKGLPSGHRLVITQAREAAAAPLVKGISPELLWHFDEAGWNVLGFEHVHGRAADYSPGSPDINLVTGLMRALAAIEIPPRPADGTAEGGEAEVGTAPGPDSAVTAEAVAAIAQAADEAGKALAAGNLDVALAALDTARDLAAQGRRAVKAAASGRRAPATRPGAVRDLVEEHLRKFPGTAFTPHQVGKVLTRSAGAVANALDKLVSLGTAEMVTDKPRTYRLASAAPASAPGAAGDPAASAEAAPSAG